MRDSDSYDEETEDALRELDAQMYDNLHYAMTSLEERNKSEAMAHIENVENIVDDIAGIDAKGVLDIWNQYGTHQGKLLSQLQNRVQNQEYSDAIDTIDKMQFLDPLAFDDNNPNYRHPDEW